MMRTNVFALVIATDDYVSYARLPSARADAERVSALLRDPQQGAVPNDNLRVLRSPTREEAAHALVEWCRRAGREKNGQLITYVAGHGVTMRRNALAIAVRDTDPNNLALTALPLGTLANIFSEHAPSRSITILDLCHAGAHGDAIVELALNESWKRDEVLCEGHFILASCAADEKALENTAGGKFTSLLVELTEKIGRERPYQQIITIDLLASNLIEAAAQVLSQRPTWSGISVAAPLEFVRNRYWDPNATRPPGAVSLESIDEGDHPRVREFVRVFHSPMQRVGSGREWSVEACALLEELTNSTLPAAARATTIARLAELAADRVATCGVPTEEEQLLELFTSALVCIAAAQGVEGPASMELAYRISTLSEGVLRRTDEYLSHKGWLPEQDGPAAIALAPIRYWDVLGRVALVALASMPLQESARYDRIVDRLLEGIRAVPDLHRIEWAGQYPDIVAVLSVIARRERPLALECAKRLLDCYVERASQGLLPEAATLDPQALGTALARRYAGTGAKLPAIDPWADEGPAMLLFLLYIFSESSLALGGRVGRLNADDYLGDYYLYAPKDFRAQFVRTMMDCEVLHWIRRSEESSAKMLKDFESLAHKFAGAGDQRRSLQALATYCAGRVYRNRSCFALAWFLESS